jgi:hypothetical protein
MVSPTKKWPGIFGSTTFLLRLILKISYVLVFLVSLSKLFQRIMTDRMNEDWYEMCLWIYQGGRFPLTLELPVIRISNRGQFSFIFYTTIIFGEISEHYYLETFKKTWLKIFCYHRSYFSALQLLRNLEY